MYTPSLPQEILIRIFSFACTDTGTTGYSLSLVSKAFYHALRRTGVDLQSASVCGVTQMLKFAAMLERRKALREPRHVKNLYISDRELPKQSSSRSRGGGDFEICKTALEHSFSFLVFILNSISTSHLQRLTIDFEVVEALPSLVPILLPALEELTVSGPIDSSSFRNSHRAPSLKRLHIASHDSLPTDFWSAISYVSPNIVDLRISSIGREDTHFLHSLKQLKPYRHSAGDWSPLDQEFEPPRGTPKSLEQVIIGFAPCYRCSARGSSVRWYRSVDAQLRAISREVGLHPRTGKSRVITLDAPLLDMDYQKTGVDTDRRRWLWNQWSDGLNGKKHFWDDQ
ncbi:hypothetical protein NLI96_g2238 [Meripilus lineatus]|uniref:F-box domain-containing protein n=1 Tax=Meripilus lineatus TaxID=2056292 RepID=A0AAD5YM65_9APHY|nr:hypothetical protein NLI96_g2238 [Physisporinus lineatus]